MVRHDAPTGGLDVEGPFDSIESAHEYVALLLQEVDANAAGIQEDVCTALREGAGRRLDALRLTEFKLKELARHLSASRRLLNDLRLLHRLLTDGGRGASHPATALRPDAPQDLSASRDV